MPNIPCIPPLLRRLAPTLGRMAATFLLSAAQLGQAYAPCALACVALAGPGSGGFLCLLGAAAGALVFFPFQPGLRFLAAAILIYAANTAFFDTRFYLHPRFRPLLCITATTLVQLVWLVERQLPQILLFLASLAAQWTACHLLAPLFGGKEHPHCRTLLGLCLCAALYGVRTSSGFSLGRALLSTVLLPCAAAAPAQGVLFGLLAGLTMDLIPERAHLQFTVLPACGCALAALTSRRWSAAALYCGGFAAAVLLFGLDRPLVLFWEAAVGAALHLLLHRSPHEAAAETEALPPSPLQAQLDKSAAAFRDLYDSFFRGTEPAPPENPAVLFDRTAQQVCRKCVLRQTCWHQDYNTTYNAFNDACPHLMRRGQALAQDFPLHFTSRCVRIQEFLAVLNSELHTFLLRRQHHRQLEDLRRQAREQYAQLGELLSATAAVEAVAAAPMGYSVSPALRPREGCRVCGDQLAVFEVGDTLYLLLSDGMGSGEEAHREAAMTVRLLRQFLEAGIEPTPALRTLNDAMALRGQEGGGFTTIDLLALQRSSGSAVLYKYGAAPSYLKQGGSVSRFTAASLPAGLQSSGRSPACSRFALPGGSFFVMVSDGIADQNDDEWLQNLLAGWDGQEADALTQLILRESRSRRGLQDDCAVLSLYLGPGKSSI